MRVGYQLQSLAKQGFGHNSESCNLTLELFAKNNQGADNNNFNKSLHHPLFFCT